MSGPWEKYQAQSSGKPWERYRGAVTEGDVKSPLPNDLISQGRAAVSDMTQRAQPRVVATTADGGRIMEDAQGVRSFASPNYSTTNPDRIAQITEGATPAEASRSGMNQDIIAQNPGIARAVKVVEGTPFIGSRLDEAVGATFGEDAGAAVQATSQAMEAERPGESLGLNVLGGVVGGGAMAAAALPGAAAATSSLGPLARAALAGLAGGTAGGVEGAIYGSGRAEGGGRAQNAIEGAMWGTGLGAFGAGGGSFLRDGIKSLARRVKKLDAKVIAQELGVSQKTAQAMKGALEVEDLATAQRTFEALGSEAMLADAGPSTAGMLDASAQTGGAALVTTRNAIDGRTSRMNDKLRTSLDLAFGKPAGRKAANKAISQSTAGARSKAYDTAFSKPINYASDKGRNIEGVLERVPARTLEGAVREANEAMQAEGLRNQQIMASILGDGSVEFSEMPNVQQVHQIKIALQDIAARETDNLTGQISDAGRRASRLAAELREALGEAVPAYKVANRLGGDTIEAREALAMGERLLKPRTSVEDVQDFMANANKASKDQMKQGVRNSIEEMIGNVKQNITNPNLDAPQSIKLVKELSSENNRAKLVAAVGEKNAERVFKQLDQTATALELRASVARGSQTFGRMNTSQQVREMAAPGVIGTAAQARPVEATQRFVQVLTGATPEVTAGREQAIFDEIAEALTRRRGPDTVKALERVQAAMRGQPLKDEEALRIANMVTAPLAITGDTYGREMLAR